MRQSFERVQTPRTVLFLRGGGYNTSLYAPIFVTESEIAYCSWKRAQAETPQVKLYKLKYEFLSCIVNCRLRRLKT